jgi:peptide/nickel transport system substrate-binding protein
MRTKWMILLTGVLVLTIILHSGHQLVSAAPPTGEVKTAASDIGVGVPIPYLERTTALDWTGLLYDSLVGNTHEGKLSPELGLANKWEMSRDGLTWTFHLRKGVKFHDGVELTAKDVKFSIEQNMLPDAIEYYFIKEYVKNIDVPGPYTVVINCKNPCVYMAFFLSNIMGSGGMVIPKEYYERLGKDQFAKRPIGSGPYKWHSQVVGSSIKLEATEKHWRDGVPKYKYMTYLVIPEEVTRMSMLRTGEADIARISREGVREALSVGLNVLTKENAFAFQFQPNMQWTSPVFSDIRFRKALNLAIDKEGIIKHLLAGLAKPAAFFPGSHMAAFEPSLLNLKPYPYDPAEARRLIKEGGWEGYEFTLISMSRAWLPEYPKIVEAVAASWEKIGLKPKIRVTDWAVYRKAFSDRKTQNIIHGTESPVSPDIVTLLERISDRWDFSQRRSTVNIPEMNERFEKIAKSLDISEITKLLAEICRYAYDHYLLVPMCDLPDIIAANQRIPKWNLGVHRTGNNYYELIRQR